MSSLQGKVAIVTGGSRGIGKAICHRLARDGASVVVNYASNTAQAEETVKQIGTERALAVKADASKVSEIQELVDATMKKFGRIDLVIAAAGIMPLCELDKLTEEEFDSLFNLNVKGPMFLVQVGHSASSQTPLVTFNPESCSTHEIRWTHHALLNKPDNRNECYA